MRRCRPIMNKQKKYLLILMALAPLAAFASGGDVLAWLWIELFVIVGFVTTVVFVEVNWIGKALIIFIFIVTEFFTIMLTNNLPYYKNRVMINLISLIAPIVTTIVSCWTIPPRFKKK
jgi:hypothetical protein